MGTVASADCRCYSVDWRHLAAAGAVAGVASGVAFFYTRGHPPPPPPPAEEQEEEEESSSSDSPAEAQPGHNLFGYGGTPTPSLAEFIQECFADRAPPPPPPPNSPQTHMWIP